MAESRLDILINAKNNASAAIKQVQGDLGGLNKVAGGLAGGLGGAAGLLGVAGLGALALGLASAGIGASQAAASFSATERALQGMASAVGESSSAMLNALREASGGAIADSQLVLSANKAMMLGVAKNTNDMTRLMDIAVSRGKAMGLSVSQAFNDIVTGLGRGSALILDNLGIVVNAEQANEKYAASIGKTAGALTDAERKQALINAVLSESGSLAAAAANPYERLGAATENFRVAVGRFINEGAGFPGLLNDIATGIQNVVNNINEGLRANAENTMFDVGPLIVAAATRLNEAVSDMQDAAIGGDVAGLNNAANRIMNLREEVTRLANEYNAAAAVTGAPLIDIGLLQGGVVAFVEMGDAVRVVGDEAVATGDKILAMVDKAHGAINAMAAQLYSTLGAQGALGAATQMNEALDAQIKLWEEQKFTQDDIVNVLIPGWLDGQRDVNREINNSATATARVSKEYQSLLSSVQSVLSGSLDPGVGVNPEDFLPRVDAINEDARRLADIAVNGFKSPWVDYFRTEHPALFAQFFSDAFGGGDIQAQAAQLLKNFQDGLVPELIDRDRAKDLVRRLITGEQNMATLAQQIAGELATEMGISAQQALGAAREALGVGDNGGAGGEAASAFDSGMAQGLASTNTGSNFVNQLTAQMRASFKLITSAGTDAGAAFASGFASGSSNIPAEFINLLAQMITPGVEAALGRRATQMGAVP